jgi:hypothetical protein
MEYISLAFFLNGYRKKALTWRIQDSSVNIWTIFLNLDLRVTMNYFPHVWNPFVKQGIHQAAYNEGGMYFPLSYMYSTKQNKIKKNHNWE